jgi:hypothetical protein
MARRTGTTTELAAALLTYGVGANEEDPRAALKALMECAGLASAAGLRPLEGLALANASEGAVDLGEWDIAEWALRDSALLARDDQNDADGATMTRTMLLAHRGDTTEALALLEAMETRRNADWDVVLMRTWFLRVRSLCLLLGGDPEAAGRGAALSLSLDGSGGNASLSLWVAVHASAAVRDPVPLRAALEGTGGLRGQWIRLVRATASACLSALEQAPGGQFADTDSDTDAAGAMRAALDGWIAAELPLDHAFATLDALNVLPDLDGLQAHVARARAYLEGLHAASLLRLYDEARP